MHAMSARITITIDCGSMPSSIALPPALLRLPLLQEICIVAHVLALLGA
jgi:hypothetical protein